ncbi:FHA domain-containing protein At4g14490, partial [Linum grandiflorum]
MEEEPWLALAILQGPRAGETLEFRPGSTVKIGRVLRGNTFGIKDAGISSKHLLIKSESGGKWTVQDLDSSNGTILNSSSLTPFQSADLSDGDQIKLGEVTSMAVQFVFKNQNPQSPPQLRRSRSRVRVTDKTEADNLESIDASAAAAAVDNGPKRRGRPPRPRVPAPNAEGPPAARVTRSKKNEKDDIEESSVQLEKKRPATRRGKKKLPEIPPENPDPVVVEVKEEEVSFVEEAREGGDGNGVVDSSGDNRRPREAREGGDGNGGADSSGDNRRLSEAVVGERRDEQAPTTNEHGNSSEQKRGEEGEAEVEEKVDLEKMTAREWFDYMEVQLRKQTMEATENI